MRITPERILNKTKQTVLERDTFEVVNHFFVGIQSFEIQKRPCCFDKKKSEYELDELLSYFDMEFINIIYRGALKRDPDAAGFDSRLRSLREREYSRVNLLGRVRFSEEGKKAGVKINGLKRALVAERVYGLPIVGRLLAILRALWSLPALHSHIEAMQGDVFALRNELDGQTEKMAKHYNEQLRVIVESTSERLYELSDKKKHK